MLKRATGGGFARLLPGNSDLQTSVSSCLPYDPLVAQTHRLPPSQSAHSSTGTPVCPQNAAAPLSTSWLTEFPSCLLLRVRGGRPDEALRFPMAGPYAAAGTVGTMPSKGHARFRPDRFVDPETCQGKAPRESITSGARMSQLLGLRLRPLPIILTGHAQGIPGPGRLPSRPPEMEAIGLGSQALPPRPPSQRPCGTGTVWVKTVPRAAQWAKATRQRAAVHHRKALPLLLPSRTRACPHPRRLTASQKPGGPALPGPSRPSEPVALAPSLVAGDHAFKAAAGFGLRTWASGFLTFPPHLAVLYFLMASRLRGEEGDHGCQAPPPYLPHPPVLLSPTLLWVDLATLVPIGQGAQRFPGCTRRAASGGRGSPSRSGLREGGGAEPQPPPHGPAVSFADIVTEDDIYCNCLSKTLCHVPTPVTVGFYAPFGCRLHMMLDKITALMQKEAAQQEAELLQQVQWKPRPVRGWGFPRLLWYLVFYQPVITELHLRRKNVQFLFVRFSAWQYAGTDKLWAGLVTTLCDGIRSHYGALPFSLYTVVGNKPAVAPDFCQREWHCRRRVCLIILALAAALALGIGLLYLSFSGRGPGREAAAAHGGLLKAFGGAATTLSGSGLLMALYSVGKHVFVSQRKKIERLVSREKFGSQLGFMCEVKKEVELLCDYLRFLEVFQRRRLRIVLEVTGLDTCYPERVVGVLNAINTLLSDSHAPFIFILVVDPHILASCLESAGSMKGVADNGYLFLNRTVTLPFSVPIMGRRTKLRFLEDAVQSRDDLLYRAITRQLRGSHKGPPEAEATELLGVEVAAAGGAGAGPGAGGPEQGSVEAEASQRIQEALFCLHNEQDCLYEYIPDNVVSMRRIVNTVPITVRLLHEHQARGGLLRPTPRQAVAWVVLANQWPCRLSWALQCLEDRQQVEGGPDPQAPLWGIFHDNSRELHTMTKALQNVVDLDGDPELFARFLGVDFPFTVAEAQSLLYCTVNLDHSIRRRMGLIRSVRALNPPSDPHDSEKPPPHPRDRARANPTGKPSAVS
ncbi:NTPase KAP family P-loop domain-containing protein 1 [Gracilinanus agilis]|uniref:NTPase KAP family P-loop domain-containing protein 1 n=1 Tax=Gracilinanus agilis TaxID=191870 RepID=UPI001CFE592B|nr:NTPase KAP family P-loop domain-containing protein 1 [Gracilinanus agilis]